MLNAASFASYYRSRGLKCVVRDDVDSRSGNIAMIFSDESGKLPRCTGQPGFFVSRVP